MTSEAEMWAKGAIGVACGVDDKGNHVCSYRFPDGHWEDIVNDKDIEKLVTDDLKAYLKYLGEKP